VSGGATRPDWAASTFSDGRGRRTAERCLRGCLNGRIPAIMQVATSVRPCGFSPGTSAVMLTMARLEFSRNRVHQPSLEAPDRTARETFAMATPFVCLAYRSRLVRSFAAWPAWRALNDWPANRHRSWDFALRSFSPAGQFRPRSRGGCPRVVYAVPITPIGFRRGIGRRTEPDSNQTRTGLSISTLRGRF
jgi:hypothetical protein